jgi:hypothetical protein
MQPEWRLSSIVLDGSARTEAIARHPVVALHAWAAWNQVDRRCEERLRIVREGFADRVFFGVIDADDPEHGAFLRASKVGNLPAIVGFVRGERVETIVGLRPVEEFRAKVEGWLERASRPPGCRARVGRSRRPGQGRHSMLGWFRRRRERRAKREAVEVAPGTIHQHPGRCPLNVPGPFYTTGQCLACESPEFEAPDLLAPLNDENITTYFVKQPETAEEIERACRAIEVCCVNDLRYGGTDRAILDRLGDDEETCDVVVRDGRLILSKSAGTTG